MQKHTALYVKQFFHNFVTAQQHTNTLNLLGSSLEVLDQMINKFTNKYSIVTPPYENMEGRNHQEQGFQTIVSALYGKLCAVFEWVEHSVNNNQKQGDSMESSINDTSSITNRSFAICQTNDEQLYQILNEYKTNNKKLKQSIASLTQKLETKNKELKQLKITKQIGDKQIDYTNLRVEELQQQLKDLQATLQTQEQEIIDKNTTIVRLEQKIQEIRSQSSASFEQIKNYRDQINNLTQKCKQLEEQNLSLTRSIDKAQKQNRQTLNRKLSEIPALIDSKLNSGKVDMAGVQVLMKYIKCSQTVKNNMKEQSKLVG